MVMFSWSQRRKHVDDVEFLRRDIAMHIIIGHCLISLCELALGRYCFCCANYRRDIFAQFLRRVFVTAFKNSSLYQQYYE